MATTLKDVAARAGVSAATVSLVLSDRYRNRVSETTVQRVRAAADEVGYRGNRVARSLRTQSSTLLGLLSLGVATQPYAGAMLEAAQARAREYNLDLLFMELGDDTEIDSALHLLQEHQVAGAIVASFYHHAVRLPERLAGPLVLADATCDRAGVDSVVPDEYASELKALEVLVAAGHRSVGWIGQSPRFGPAPTVRLNAFRDVAAAHRWSADPLPVVLVDDSDAAGGYTATHQLLDRHEVTAIACYTDRMAMGAYMACFERGLRIPQDISVVGFDDQLLISEALRPGLTTVALPHREMGTWAVDRLIARIRSDHPLAARQSVIPGDLVVRDSVGTPRTGPCPTGARS